MTVNDVNKSDLADGIIPSDTGYEATGRLKRKFLPWHRPRKQYVREYQWRVQLDHLLDNLRFTDDPVIKYLGLPGTDLIDLRYFHDVICKPKNIPLRFIGFNSEAKPNTPDHIELNISLDEVKKLSHIEKSSKVLYDDFRDLADNTSVAWRNTLENGPFDIVNLDLCNSIALEEPGTLENSHYNAMSRLFTLQSRRRNPWLFLLTTRVGRDHINEDVFDRLLSKYESNLSLSESFTSISKKYLDIFDYNSLINASKTDEGLFNIFLVGLCKWMLSNTLNYKPPIIIQLNSVIGYQVYSKANMEDLVSLAIVFKPTLNPLDDPLGLSGLRSSDINEPDLAINFIAQIADRHNADSILDSDYCIRSSMEAGMSKLLELARYDISSYEKWIQNGYSRN